MATRGGLAVDWGGQLAAMADRAEARAAATLAGLHDLGGVSAARVEGAAKAGAPWTDRTGNARQGLFGRAIPTPTGVLVVLGGTASYQIWLELAHGGRYAIILQTLEAEHPALLADAAALVA